MMTMISRTLSILLVTTLLLEGCVSQVVGEQFLMGNREREEPSGTVVEESRTRTVDLLSPCSVRVGERITRSEETIVYYEKLLLQQKATPLAYPYLDAYLKMLLSTTLIPLFTPSYWVQGSYAGPDCKKQPGKCSVRDVSSVIPGEYVAQRGSRALNDEVRRPGGSRTVSIFMNGYYQGDVPIGPDATASVVIPDTTALMDGKDLKITFKYDDAYAYSVVRRADIENVRKACEAGSRPVRAEHSFAP